MTKITELEALAKEVSYVIDAHREYETEVNNNGKAEAVLRSTKQACYY